MPTTRSGEPWGRALRRGLPAEACTCARITRPASFHVLRHTYASHLVMVGVRLPVVAQNLGHAHVRFWL